MTAVQDGPTSIRVSWTPSSDATGYMIHYTSSRGDSGSEDVSGGHSDSYTLTGLVKEDTYTISIMATSQVFSSSPITVELTLSEEDPIIQLLILFSLSPVPAPGVVSVSVGSITASSISLSWSVASGSVASWEVVWRETDRGTESSSGSLTGTSYTIDQLESTTIYTVTVRASNVAGTTDSQPITFSTGECVMCIYNIPARSIFSTAASEAERDSSCAESDNTAGIIAGVVVTIVAVALITALTVIVVVKSRRQPTTK